MPDPSGVGSIHRQDQVSGESKAPHMQERLREGYVILDAFLKENGSLPTPELFRRCWKLILKNETLFHGAETQTSRYNVDAKSVAYVRFALFFKLLRPEFVPPVKLAVGSPDLGVSQGSIFLTIHSELELAIAKLLQGGSGRVAMISAAPRNPRMVELFGLSPAPDIIRRSSNCLILARQALVSSSSLVFDIDYAVFDKEQQRFLHKISPAGFLFAKKVSRPLYFVRIETSVDGEIMCAVRLSQGDGSVNELAEHFRSFVNARAIPVGELPVGNWFMDTGRNLSAGNPGSNPKS